MQNLENLKEKIFFESKILLQSLAEIDTVEDLISKQNFLLELTERVSFLKILKKNTSYFESKSEEVTIEEDVPNLELQNFNDSEIDSHLIEEDQIEEEVLFTNELNKKHNNFDEEETKIDNSENETSLILNESVAEKEHDKHEENIPLLIEQFEPDYAERVAQKEKDYEELEKRRRSIIEFDKEEAKTLPKEDYAEDYIEKPAVHAEKKFRIANIKGLNVVKNLFDDDPFEDMIKEEENIKPLPEKKTESIITSESSKHSKKDRIDFKLDLNDRMAFSKILFNGNDQELISVISKLNTFKEIEQAREFLSELYYQKEWSKKDEYAQRLWTLVENKFI